MFCSDENKNVIDFAKCGPVQNGHKLLMNRIEPEQAVLQEPFDFSLIKQSHKNCMSNRKKLEESDLCGCFYCLAIYNPSEIEEWIEDKDDDTAICPHCHTDAVLPENDDYPLNAAFLKQMSDSA